MQYFVVMIDYGRRGREAIVDPEITRREVIARVASGEYRNISFIHEIADSAVDDITVEILAEASGQPISKVLDMLAKLPAAMRPKGDRVMTPEEYQAKRAGLRSEMSGIRAWLVRGAIEARSDDGGRDAR